jgi:hypothetical protein
MQKLIVVRSGEYDAQIGDLTKESRSRVTELAGKLKELADGNVPDALCFSEKHAAGITLGILMRVFRSAKYPAVPHKEIPFERAIPFVHNLFVPRLPYVRKAEFIILVAHGDYPANFILRYTEFALNAELTPRVLDHGMAMVLNCETKKAERIN